MKIPNSLQNYLLIAMPNLQNSFFTKTVVYVYEHNEKGAMGIVVNKALQITLDNLFQHLDIELDAKELADIPILTGGPVAPEQGFVLHQQTNEKSKKTQPIITLSASKEILRNIGLGKGPEHFLIALGYTGWGPGQLEQELNRNDWLIAPIQNPSLLFETPIERRWAEAAKILGIDINRLSGQAGHA